jgi:hypothetical protein
MWKLKISSMINGTIVIRNKRMTAGRTKMVGVQRAVLSPFIARGLRCVAVLDTLLLLMYCLSYGLD